MTCKIKHRCNSFAAIQEAAQQGYGGAEIDLVWYDGGLILSHEHGGLGESFERILPRLPPKFVLAINVKEYGMAPELKRLLTSCSQHFVFDVPGPELEIYRQHGIRHFGRFSEVEVQLSCYGRVIDSFYSQEHFVRDHIGVGDALISRTLRGAPEWPEELVSLATYLVTK